MEPSVNDVLRRYPSAVRGHATPLGNHGGFSGADLWHIDQSSASFCLKRWPVDGRTRDELLWIHQLLTKADRIPWIPRVVATTDGNTLVTVQDRHWELTTWMPGKADFAAAPSRARVESACTSLAQLHAEWATLAASVGACPGVQRRLQAWNAWTELLQSGWLPRLRSLDPFSSIAQTLFQAVQRQIDEVPRLLEPWRNMSLPLQPCVCDPWHDHILFTGNAVTGLIDFGSAKFDHVAVDLARMLGSLVGDDAEAWRIGVSAYVRVRSLSEEDCRFARALDRTGTIIAATHWLRWLYHEQRTYEQPSAVLTRLHHLASRLV